MLLNLGAKWKKRGSFQKTTIYYCMLFNLFAYWNETRRTVFKNKTKNTNLLQYVIQLVCILKWNKMVSFQKNPINDNMLLNLCAKWNKRGSFQKTTIYYSMLFNKRGIFQKTTIYYCMIFNLCAYWNETRGTVFKKKTNNLLQYAIQQEGHFSKNNNLLLINKSGQFYYCMIFNLCAYWNETRWTVIKKIQLMTICYWTRARNETRGAVFKKNNLMTICYWNKMEKTRGAVFKNQQFITVCYSTCVRIEMKQEGQFSKTKQKTPIYYSMLFNKRGSFEKQQFITVWYSTCVHIEMKQEGQFSTTKKNTNLLQYAIQLVRVLKWNKMVSFQKNPINDNMLLNLCAKWNKRGSFQKTTIYYCMLFNLCP